MAREALELELLSLRFKRYTSNIRECVSRVVSPERCKDTSDKVIDELLTNCPDEIASLLANSHIDECDSGGSGSPDVSAEAREVIRTYIDHACDYEAELRDLEDDDFEALYRTTIDPIVQAKRERRARLARENDRWAFFNKADANADFERWRTRLLSPAQAVALSFGKDPDVVTPESLKPYKRVVPSPFREAFKDRLDLIEAAVAAGKLTVLMSVGDLERWAVVLGIDLPPALTGQDVTPGEDAAFWKAKYEATQNDLERLRRGIDDLNPLSRASIYRMIIGMAIARFEYRTGLRSKATSTIRDELRRIEITLSDEAIHGHLIAAANELNITWPQPITWTRSRRSPT